MASRTSATPTKKSSRTLSRARIAAWLVETSGETQVWSDVYDRSLADALVVQADVAARVIRALASHIPVRPAAAAREEHAHRRTA